MNISLNWIGDFVTLPDLCADELANSFTMTTAEVEGVTTTLAYLKEIKVAQIKSITKHPEADKLKLVTFDFGSPGFKEVVCGAPNVKVGLKVPYAPLGVSLPTGLVLTPKKIRGYLSEGMLCSEEELGLEPEGDGLMELPEDAPIGTAMVDFLKMNSDTVLDVDNKSLTHRPDLWGHYGIAREFAAAYGQELKTPYDKSWEKKCELRFTSEDPPVRAQVEQGSSCKAYWGLSINNVKVESSPVWMVNRLEACGLRSINNIVDISNYVMLELGSPLHIFDREKISDNKIIIKKLGEEEKFQTLDELERKLTPTDTVICDSEKILVLAGIMGGLNSGVNEGTSDIFIEVANWVPEEIRKTSTRLGLRTDSSQRFEKSLDSLQCYKTLLRTMELVLELCPGAKIVGKAQYAGEDLSNVKQKTITTSRERITSTLGHDISEEKILSIFNSLGFEVDCHKGTLEVKLPSFRTTKDIEYEACLIEEVGRIIGYDSIVPVAPVSAIKATRFIPAKQLHRDIQDFMVLKGKSLEVMTYPLIGRKLLDKSMWPIMNEELLLVNALSEDADRMRPSLIPHALNTVGINVKNFEKFNFFELGRSYLSDQKKFSVERDQLLVGMFNKQETPFIELINRVEELLNYVNIPFSMVPENENFSNSLLEKQWPGIHPHEFLNIKIMGKFCGVISSVHPVVLKAFKTKGYFSFAVIDLTDFQNRKLKNKTKYSSISKYPSSKFDCTVLAPKSIPCGSVLEVLQRIKVKEMIERKIVDVYSQSDDMNAITLTVTLENFEKTLDSDFIKACEGKVVSSLDQAGFPLKH